MEHEVDVDGRRFLLLLLLRPLWRGRKLVTDVDPQLGEGLDVLTGGAGPRGASVLAQLVAPDRQVLEPVVVPAEAGEVL